MATTTIRVEQALFGEVNRRHACVTASEGVGEEVLERLLPFSDIPSTPSAPIEWSPYLSGLPIRDRYVFCKTVDDEGADRGGMVLTHTLIVDQEIMARTASLDPFIDALPSDVVRREALSSFKCEVPVDSTIGFQSPADSLPDGFRSVVQDYLRLDDRPIAWLGQESFNAVVRGLWAMLWPGPREELSFRLSFRPEDVGSEPPDLVVVPDDASVWWRGRLVSPESEVSEESLSEKFLLGRGPQAQIREFFASTEAEVGTITDVKTLVRGYERCKGMTEASVEQVRACARLLAAAAPSNNKGAELKTDVLSRLIALTREADGNDVLALQNFESKAFPRGTAAVEGALEDWIERVVMEEETSADVIDVLEAVSAENFRWASAMSGALERTIVENWDESVAVLIWQWWRTSADLIELVGGILPKEEHQSQHLVASCPTELSQGVGEEVVALAEENGWFHLHAAVCSGYLAPDDAIEEHLSCIEREDSRESVTATLAERLPNDAVVEAAVKTGDEALIEAAANCCAEDPSLLASLEARKTVWRRIWAESLKRGLSPWTGIDEPDEVMSNVLEVSDSQEPWDYSLLKSLAGTEYGHLLEAQESSRILSSFPSELRTAYVQSTAEAWIRSFVTGESVSYELEEVVRREVVSSARLRKWVDRGEFLVPTRGIEFFENCEGVRQNVFLDWMEELVTNNVTIEGHVASRIGQVINRKGWRRAAQYVYDLVIDEKYHSYLPALEQCEGQLPAYRRYRVALTLNRAPSEVRRARWEAMIQICVGLYPQGPTQASIWPRAGGDVAELRQQGTPREQWRYAINYLRQGGGNGKLSAYKLFTEVSKDFPRNEKVKTITEQFEEDASNWD